MERDDRTAVGTFFADALPSAVGEEGAAVSLGESVAHHARVKRLEVGDVVRLTNGVGTLGAGTIRELKRAAVVVDVTHVERVAPPPAIHLLVPVADRDRMLWLAEKATELGVASWRAVRFRRSASVSPRGEGDAFHDKVRGRMIAALEQSGGAWLPALLPDVALDDLRLDASQVGVLLDASGEPIGGLALRAGASLLVGPEGGIEPAEVEQLRSGGWRPARLARSILRFETAGVAAVSVVRAATL